MHMLQIHTRRIEPMLGQCWPAVYDVRQHLPNIGSMPHVISISDGNWWDFHNR